MGGLNRWVRDNNTLYIYVMTAIGHKSFKPKTFANDIGVMILAQDVPMNHPTVQPITLSTKNAAAGQSCQVGSSDVMILSIVQLLQNRFQAGER
jgi:hypothetical protein